MDLAIVILVWRNQEHLPELLRSIAAQRTNARHEVVVCHNSLDPGARREPPAPDGMALREIYTGANLGYAGGNNFAIDAIRQRADPRYFLVLNSDVVLGEGALQAAIDWADGHPEVAVTGAVQKDPSRPGHAIYGGCRYSRALSIITPNEDPNATDIDYVHGAALLLRAEAFRGADVFADHYFLFFEELELAERVRARGMKIGFCPGFRVIHHEGASRTRASSDFVPEMAEYFENLGALRYTRDHHPLLLPTVLLARGPGKLLVLALRGQGARLAFWALAFADFFRRRVRRFPFQAGWQPRLANEQLVDSDWPMRSRMQNRLQDLAFRIRFIARQGVLWTLKRLASRVLGFVLWLVLLPATVVLHALGYRHVTIFTDRIGHFALEPDCLLKEQALGRIARRRWILLAPDARVSNEHLLAYWAPHFRVVRGELACFFVSSMSGGGLMRFDGARYVRKLDKAQDAYRIQAEWGDRGPLLRLTAADEGWGREMLGQFGVPADAWFACVHAREGGFSPFDEELHGHRNGHIENLIPAIEEIVRRGGWVLRLGDPTMRPLPAMAQVVDYAHHRLKSARLDVFLCARARFILGNTSGISLVGTVFGTPCALANMVPVTALGLGPRDLSIPKLHRLPREARYMRFDEIFAMPIAKAQHRHLFVEAGIEVEESSPQDILGLVEDMFDQLDGPDDAVSDGRKLQRAFLALMRADQYSFGAASNVGARFLARHRDLLVAS